MTYYGILRDRRRKEVLEEFPREDKDFDNFKSYRDEFADHNKWAEVINGLSG